MKLKLYVMVAVISACNKNKQHKAFTQQHAIAKWPSSPHPQFKPISLPKVFTPFSSCQFSSTQQQQRQQLVLLPSYYWSIRPHAFICVLPAQKSNFIRLTD